MLASRNIVFTPLVRCLTSLCIISIFYLLLTGHDLVIQRRASFDRTRFCSGLSLENSLNLVKSVNSTIARCLYKQMHSELQVTNDARSQKFDVQKCLLSRKLIINNVACLQLYLFFATSIGVPCSVETTYFSQLNAPRLFQTWPGGPGVCLNQQFIWARHF